jgi:hypothetical protein
MSVTTLPPPQVRETIKRMRETAKRLERGDGVPVMFATAEGDRLDATGHNISPSGMLVMITLLLEAARNKANLTLGNPDADPATRQEDTRAIVFANTALNALQPYTTGKG